jgi:hypothetical protein
LSSDFPISAHRYFIARGSGFQVHVSQFREAEPRISFTGKFETVKEVKPKLPIFYSLQATTPGQAGSAVIALVEAARKRRRFEG